MAQRHFLAVNGKRVAYLDFGGVGSPLLALHGHFSCARTFAGLADALRDSWRIIALDQRGHGWSDIPDDYSREAYINDLVAVIEHLKLDPVVVLGHSLGGLNAYQLAARRPNIVRAMIVEDIGAMTDQVPPIVPDWPERFESIRQVLDFFAAKGWGNGTYFLESVVEYPDGWGFRFNYNSLVTSQQLLQGNWWNDWLASTCPALLLHGHTSWVLKTEHAREMASRRPNTRLVEFPDCGHTIHDASPAEFYKAVKEFLESITS